MGNLYCLLGPSGSGKTAIAKALQEYGISELISHTSRKPRTGEADGVNYWYVTSEEFEKIDFIEKVTYSGNQYGLSKQELLEKINNYENSVVVVDINGVQMLKDFLGENVKVIFLEVDKDTIVERMRSRGDSEEEIEKRISYAFQSNEFDNGKFADFIVKNNKTLKDSITQILEILNIERERKASI